MDTPRCKQKTYIFCLFCLVVICNVLLNINNMVVQSLGIVLLPLIVVNVLKIMISDQKRDIG